MTTYAAMRTHGARAEYLWEELQDGRLRAGWGYRPEQDLRRIRTKRRGSEPLADYEKSAWRHRRLLESTPDGLREGDVMLLPHVAGFGTWVLCEITGDYHFDVDGDGDYGHIRPVRIVQHPERENCRISPLHHRVSPALRRAMSCRARLWSLEAYEAELQALVGALHRGEDLSGRCGPERRFDRFVATLRDHAANELRHAYATAELEELVDRIVRNLYPGAAIMRTPERKEMGIDLRIETTDPLGFDAAIGIQVMCHSGTEWDIEGLERLRRAAEAHEISHAVVVTTASEMSDEYKQRRGEIEKTVGVPIRVILREECLRMLLTSLDAGG